MIDSSDKSLIKIIRRNSPIRSFKENRSDDLLKKYVNMI